MPGMPQVEELIPEGTKLSALRPHRFHQGKDTMDVWFDAGSSHIAVLEQREGLRWPADLYLEGTTSIGVGSNLHY